MNFVFHVVLTAVLSALLAISIQADRQWVLLGLIVVMSEGLWTILEGIWQPTYAFSVVEPSLLVVVMAGILSASIPDKGHFTALALSAFVATGCLTTWTAQQWQGINPTIAFGEALRSGTPIVVAAISAIAVYKLAVSAAGGESKPIVFAAALTLALFLDSTLYLALSSGWVEGNWIQPLLLKLTDKLLLALLVVTPVMSWGLVTPKQTVNSPSTD